MIKEGKKKKKRNLRDKERVLYAPYSNVGQINLDNADGYINIPDNNVIYTRIDEENKDELNEGQKLVFGLQDTNTGLNQDILKPQLLQGIDINDQVVIKKKQEAVLEKIEVKEKPSLYKER